MTVTNTETPNASSTSIVSSANPSVYGQSVTFTATVNGVAPMTGTPTGTVTFVDGTTNLGTITLNAGSATYTTSTLGAGVHDITVTYGGNAYFSPDTSSTLAETITPATLTVAANNATKVYGQANPAFSDTLAGFVNGENAGVVNGSASLTTAATARSGIGSYAINAAQGSLSAANYTFAFANGTLTITPVPAPPLPTLPAPTPPTSIPPVSLMPGSPSSASAGAGSAGDSRAPAGAEFELAGHVVESCVIVHHQCRQQPRKRCGHGFFTGRSCSRQLGDAHDSSIFPHSPGHLAGRPNGVRAGERGIAAGYAYRTRIWPVNLVIAPRRRPAR